MGVITIIIIGVVFGLLISYAGLNGLPNFITIEFQRKYMLLFQ